MIKLDIEKYCEDCESFQPKVVNCTDFHTDYYAPPILVVTCERRDICHTIYRRIKKEEEEK